MRLHLGSDLVSEYSKEREYGEALAKFMRDDVCAEIGRIYRAIDGEPNKVIRRAMIMEVVKLEDAEIARAKRLERVESSKPRLPDFSLERQIWRGRATLGSLVE